MGPLRLELGQKYFGFGYIHPVGMRTATDQYFCGKSANLKHPNVQHVIDDLHIKNHKNECQ